jgi:hypothetical protein
MFYFIEWKDKVNQNLICLSLPLPSSIFLANYYLIIHLLIHELWNLQFYNLLFEALPDEKVFFYLVMELIIQWTIFRNHFIYILFFLNLFSNAILTVSLRNLNLKFHYFQILFHLTIMDLLQMLLQYFMSFLHLSYILLKEVFYFKFFREKVVIKCHLFYSYLHIIKQDYFQIHRQFLVVIII